MKPTFKQAKVLFSLRPLKRNEKLFTGKWDKFVIVQEDEHSVTLEFTEEGRPGYSQRTFSRNTYDGVLGTWIESPLINKSGVASVLWSDNVPNILRRRLEQKVEHFTLTMGELEILYNESKKLSDQVRNSLQIIKLLTVGKDI